MKDLNGLPFRRRKKDEDTSVLAIQLSQLTQQISNGTGTGSGGALVFNTLTDLQNAYPNGSTQPAWVIADQEWYYWSGTITPPTDTTAPTITCSSSGGTFSSAQTVTLSSNETATIYYTLDGSAPTTSSSVYSSALTISSTSTLKFFGKDTAGNQSMVQSVSFTINVPDTTAPTISASVQGGTYTSAQTVTLSANETATVYYTTDGSTPTYPVSGTTQTYSSALNISATTTLKYIGRDSAGNVSSPVTQTYTINIDTTPPVVTASPAAGTYTSTQSVTLSTEAGATIYYTTDGSTSTTSSPIYSAPISISTTTTLQFIGKDAAGNISTPVVATYTINSLTTVVSDTFTDTDGTSLATHTPDVSPSANKWSVLTGSAVINTNQASFNTVVVDSLAVIDSGKSDATISVKLSAIATNNRLVFRCTDSNNLLLVQVGTGNYQLFKKVAGTYIQIGSNSIGVTPTSGDVLKVITNGSSIQVFVNSTQIFNATETANQTATKHGIGVNGVSNSVNARWDNFTVSA